MTGLDVEAFAELLRSAVVLPVLRAAAGSVAVEQVERCVGFGIPLVELTTTTPDWPAVLDDVQRRWPSLVVGVGTVLEPGQAQAALDLGAAFLATPCPVPEVRLVAGGRAPVLEGGFTPGELLAATSRGIGKLFPAHVGGSAMLRSVLALRPGARMVPTGGITLDDVPGWLRAGALAVGIGAGLLDEPDLGTRIRALRGAAGVPVPASSAAGAGGVHSDEGAPGQPPGAPVSRPAG